MTNDHKEKLALFCGVEKNLVIEEQDVKHTIYEVPIELARQDVDVYLLEMLNLHVNPLQMDDWHAMVRTFITPPRGEVDIAVVGKYIKLRDSYKSIYEALTHGGVANKVKVNIRMVESEEIEARGCDAFLSGVRGILIPGGFGDRGIEGKISAIRFAREQRIPFLGICLGMQCAVTEFARHVCGMTDANSTEFNPGSAHPVIDLMEHQKQVKDKGGTMRLGSYPCVLAEGSRAFKAYGVRQIAERHRHRYEFNNAFRERIAARGLRCTGLSPDGTLVEMVELADHPWFVGCQFHPEFQSTPLRAHPLFRDFIDAAVALRDAVPN